MSTRRPSGALVAGGFVLFACAAVLPLTHALYVADGPSMEPTLVGGSRFIMRRSWIAADPEPGDLVVAVTPYGDTVVKRVVAVERQTIALEESTIVIDGEPRASGWSPCGDERVCAEERAAERRWRVTRDAASLTDSAEYGMVPPGHVFLLGDYRDHSNDSRHPGISSLPQDAIVGVVVWP